MKFRIPLVVLACLLMAAGSALAQIVKLSDAGPSGAAIRWLGSQPNARAGAAGLIRGGCARLPPVARAYRDLTDADGQLRPDVSVSERDARVTTQVLHVVMRDLDPGR